MGVKPAREQIPPQIDWRVIVNPDLLTTWDMWPAIFTSFRHAFVV
jgi:hypothetical protein